MVNLLRHEVVTLNRPEGVNLSVFSTLEAGIEVSYTLEKNLCEFSLAEATGSITFGKGIEINHQDNHRKFNMSLATEYSRGLLSFTFLNALTTDPFLESSVGTEISIEAEYVKNTGFENFGLNFELSEKGSISLADFSTWNQLSFNIPMNVIKRNLQAENLIGFVAPFCYPSYSNKKISLYPGIITEYLDYYINDTPIELMSFENYVTMSRYQSSKYGMSWGLNIDLTAALGIGAGIKLGIEYAFLDELKCPLSNYAIIKNQLLPISEINPLTHEDRLFSVTDEIYDLFHGTALLIKEPLRELQQKVEQSIESGKEFVISVFNTTAKITGSISQTGKLIIRKISSPIKRTKKSAFIGSQVINAYTSGKVSPLDPSKKSTSEETASTLYIISDHFNVSMLDEAENVILDFDPVNLSIATVPQIIQELGFGMSDLEYARMYFYDDDTFTWVELDGDLNETADTVESLVSNSGTYAVGVNYSANMDVSPVEIEAFFPANLHSIQPNDTLWVRLYEYPIGSGIDFSRTEIVIDGNTVEAIWNPITNTLMYIPAEPISDGEHSFTVNVYDNNDNFSNVFSVFKVVSTSIDYSLVMDNSFQFTCYPNPAQDKFIISIYQPDKDDFGEISFFNAKGELIAELYAGKIHQGLNEFQLDKNSFSGVKIDSGIYFLQYKNGRNTLVKKLVFE